MSILANAEEIERLYGVSFRAECENRIARFAFEEATRRRTRSEEAMKETDAQINVLFDEIAASIPIMVKEAFILASVLERFVDGSVFLEDDSAARERADRIISNLVLGLSRLANADSETLPSWLKIHTADGAAHEVQHA